MAKINLSRMSCLLVRDRLIEEIYKEVDKREALGGSECHFSLQNEELAFMLQDNLLRSRNFEEVAIVWDEGIMNMHLSWKRNNARNS